MSLQFRENYKGQNAMGLFYKVIKTKFDALAFDRSEHQTIKVIKIFFED